MPRDRGQIDSSNVVFYEFFRGIGKSFNWWKYVVENSHSKKNSVEISSKSNLGAILLIGKHVIRKLARKGVL